MTQNQKILIGVGLLGLGYLLWKNSKKSSEVSDPGNGTGNGLSESLPTTIKNGAVINGKKYSILSQKDCPDGYTFGVALAQPCARGTNINNCDSGGPRCVRLTPVTSITSSDIFSKRMCPSDLMPCPDDSGCFDPSKNPISDWEAGRAHPCNRSLVPLKNWS